MSSFLGLWLGFLKMPGWLFPHPPVALYKGSQSNFTPGHTCQLVCQFHFSWRHPSRSQPPSSPIWSPCSLGLQHSCPQGLPFAPTCAWAPLPWISCLHLSWFTTLFWWSIPFDMFLRKSAHFWHLIWHPLKKKCLLFPSLGLIVWLCIKFKHWSNFLSEF